jgi:hypothetical protein
MNARPAGCERASVDLRLAQVAFDYLNVTFRRERSDRARPAEKVKASIRGRIKLRQQASTDEAGSASYE